MHGSAWSLGQWDESGVSRSWLEGRLDGACSDYIRHIKLIFKMSVGLPHFNYIFYFNRDSWEIRYNTFAMASIHLVLADSATACHFLRISGYSSESLRASLA